MYETGLALLIGYDSPRQELITVGRAYYQAYDSMVDRSNYFQIKDIVKRQDRGHSYEIKNKMNESVADCDLKKFIAHKEFTQEWLGLNVTDRIKQHVSFYNGIQDRNYEIVAGTSIAEVYNNDIDDDNALVIFSYEKKEIGRFVMIDYDLLMGNIYGLEYHFRYFEDKELLEIYRNKEFIGVLQTGLIARINNELMKHHNLYIKRSLDKEGLGHVMNAIVAFQMAYDIEMMALDEEFDD